MSIQKLIVGLGNPGKEYEYTRHNLGFLVVQRLAEQLKCDFKASSFTKAITAETHVQGSNVCLALPLTFMNQSGIALKALIAQKNIDLCDILVVCDDLNLPFEQMRIRAQGSDGGHNGLSSVIQHLQSEEFVRLRLGVGQAPNRDEVVDYVLQEFDKGEKENLNEFINEGVECCLVWLKEGVNKAMERYNKRKENGKD